MRFFRRLLAGLMAALLPLLVSAASTLEEVEARVTQMLADEKPDSVLETPIQGLYEVIFGGQLLYMTEDGRYVVRGKLIDMLTGKNLTEPRRDKMRADTLAKVSDDDVILFSPKNPKHTVTVFTDIDCGYCRKLHGQVAQYNDLGIAIRYMLFPRSGPKGESWVKAESVWCSADQQKAMTQAKGGRSVKTTSCENPIAMHYSLGKKVGVEGTPAIYFESGKSVPGYMPPAKLLQELEKSVSL